MLKIKYDIVGSFLRPEKIKEARAKYFNQHLEKLKMMKLLNLSINKLLMD